MIQAVQEIARQTLAACASFRTLVGAADSTAALLRIYHDALPKPASGGAQHTLAEMNALRPCAIVYTEPDRGFRRVRDAMGDVGSSAWHSSGIIHLVIFRNVPTADKDNPSLVDTAFRTVIGSIQDEIVALSETAGYLDSNAITLSGPWRTELTELNSIGDAQACELVVEWGRS